jgi:hypothetical protein
MPKCEVCGRDASRIVSGRDFCGAHRDGDLAPQVEVRLCAVPGCWSPPPHRGETYCRTHHNWRDPGPGADRAVVRRPSGEAARR